MSKYLIMDERAPFNIDDAIVLDTADSKEEMFQCVLDNPGSVPVVESSGEMLMEYCHARLSVVPREDW